MEQSSGQPHWQFKRGVSGNPWGALSNRARAERIEAKAREIADGTYDALSVRDRELLIMAATLLVQPRRRNEDPVRKANAIARLLNRVRGLRATSPASSVPSLSEEAL